MIQRILDIARAEIGTKEFPAGSNNVKYNTAYYYGEVNGSNYAWCAVFIWWLFQQIQQPGLYFDGGRSAYVPALISWGRRRGLMVSEPRAGDLVCFDFNHNDTADHIGICESWDGTYVTTIDGNTGTTSESNGGEVMRRKRHKKYIVAVIRPRYEAEDNDMDISKLTDEQVLQLANRLNEVLAKQPPANWSAEARAWAEDRGIINGNEHGDRQYKKFCTREELAAILFNQAQV